MTRFADWILNEENDFMRDNLHFTEETKQISEYFGINPGTVAAIDPYLRGKKEGFSKGKGVGFEKGKEEGIAQANRNYRGDVTISKAGRSTIGTKSGILPTTPSTSKDSGPRRLTKPIRSISSQAMAIAQSMGRR